MTDSERSARVGTMRFGWLCNDASAQPLFDCLSSGSGEHQLGWIVRDESGSNKASGNTVRIVDHWQDLLAASGVDAVVIGGSDDRTMEGAKQLATAGIPILFFPQASQTSTFIYEISLIHDDNRVPLFPVTWHAFDAAVLELKNAITNGQLGKIQFLTLRRELKKPSSTTPIPQPIVDVELLPDVEIMRWLIGDYDQITSLRTAATDQGVLMQSVVLAGRSFPEAQWSIVPVDGESQWHLLVRGETASADLYRDPNSNRWVCMIGDTRIEGNESQTAAALLTAFEANVASHQRDSASPGGMTHQKWGELIKCFETVDATHRSIRRKRTIELHFEPMSERAIFKTQMTAIGCGLLTATFFMCLCYLGIASVVPLPSTVLIALRFLVFAPLILFLLAQILLPLTRPSTSERVSS